MDSIPQENLPRGGRATVDPADQIRRQLLALAGGSGGGAVQVPVPGGPHPVAVPGGPKQVGGPAPATKTTNVSNTANTAGGNSGNVGTGNVVGGNVGGGGAAGALTNTAQTPPDVKWLLDAIKSRTGQGPTGQAIDIAGQKIRDAAIGVGAGLNEDAARRGVLGSGVNESAQANLASDLQRAIAGSASDIALGRQKDIDALLLGSQGAFEAPARLAQADKGLALQQYLGQAGLDLQKYGIDKNAALQQNQQNMQQQQQLLALITSLYS